MTTRRDNEEFDLPKDVVKRASEETSCGVRISVTPAELVEQMKAADEALNGNSNDAEHDVLTKIREWISEVFEDPDRRSGR